MDCDDPIESIPCLKDGPYLLRNEALEVKKFSRGRRSSVAFRQAESPSSARLFIFYTILIVSSLQNVRYG